MRTQADLLVLVGEARHAADSGLAGRPDRVVRVEDLRAPADDVLVERDRAVHVAGAELAPDEVSLCVTHGCLSLPSLMSGAAAGRRVITPVALDHTALVVHVPRLHPVG